jgi:hypothetical protein
VEWTVTFDQCNGAAVVRTRGEFNVSDHKLMVADIVNRDEWHPGHPILFDHRQLTFNEVGYVDMKHARDNHTLFEKRIGKARSAILMSSGADYGLGRQFQNLAEGYVSAELQVFTDESSATEWLCRAEDPTDSVGRHP